MLNWGERKEDPMTTALAIIVGWAFIAAAFYALARWTQ